jgi:integrase
LIGNRYVVREIPIKIRTGGRLKDVRKIIIGFYVEDDDIVYPHPISDFIDKEYFNYSKSLSHQKLPAYTIVQFLNYLYREANKRDSEFIDLKYKGVFGLTIEHGSSFLNYLAEEVTLTQDTFTMKVSHLTKFYDYLNNNNLVEQKSTIRTKKGQTSEILIPPFKNIKYPLNAQHRKLKKKKDIITNSNKNRVQLIREFLLTAYLTEPAIALAIAFLFYGGLRSGECMNLLKSSVKPQGGSLFGEKGFVIEVRDNQILLFSNQTNTINMEVKKPRDQAVLNDTIVSWLFKQHLKWLDKMDQQNRITNRRALFINSENGEALSGPGFRKKFEKVKTAYLDSLRNTSGRLQDYIDLTETYWSTHIGRGTFTNMIISANFSVEQTAIARGDSNLNSALHYTDVMSTMNNIDTALKILTADDFDKQSIEISALKRTWKEVEHFGKIRH